jgi:hypothetical protein
MLVSVDDHFERPVVAASNSPHQLDVGFFRHPSPDSITTQAGKGSRED